MKCYKCKQEKPETDFYKTAGYKCKECHSRAVAEDRMAKKEYYRAKRKELAELVKSLKPPKVKLTPEQKKARRQKSYRDNYRKNRDLIIAKNMLNYFTKMEKQNGTDKKENL